MKDRPEAINATGKKESFTEYICSAIDAEVSQINRVANFLRDFNDRVLGSEPESEKPETADMPSAAKGQINHMLRLLDNATNYLVNQIDRLKEANLV